MKWPAIFKDASQWLQELLVDLLKTKIFAYLGLVAVMATGVFGLALFLVDPNIHSPLDGIWSAWVTMTHVGFGDVVPVSFFGRLLAAALILLGLVFFSLFTAVVSLALIGRNMDALGLEMRRVGRETERIEGEESRILREVARVHERLDALEHRLPPFREAEHSREARPD